MRLNATDEEKKQVKELMKRAKAIGANVSFNEALKVHRKVRKANDEVASMYGYKRAETIDGITVFTKVGA